MSIRVLGHQFLSGPDSTPKGKGWSSSYAGHEGKPSLLGTPAPQTKAYIESVMLNAELGQDGINKPLPKGTRTP